VRKLRAHAEQKGTRTIQLVDAKTQTCVLDAEMQTMEGGLYISYMKDYVRKQISFPATSKNENLHVACNSIIHTPFFDEGSFFHHIEVVIIIDPAQQVL
jgi:hypothetical protein